MTTSTTHSRTEGHLVELARAATGGGSALEAFLASVRPRILRWARGLAGDWDWAEDLTQEALIRLQKSPDRLAARDPLAWCYRVLLNLYRDEHRTLRRRQGLVEQEGGSSTAAPPALATGPVLERDPVGVIHRYLHELSDRQRAAFQLVDLEGWSVARAAEALDAAESTVRVHLHRARRTLRSHILEDLP